jgi:hypothetical protein
MLVSVSVSVLDPPPSNSLLHKQFRLEAGVGIELDQRILSKSTTPQLPPHHQRRTAS